MSSLYQSQDYPPPEKNEIFNSIDYPQTQASGGSSGNYLELVAQENEVFPENYGIVSRGNTSVSLVAVNTRCNKLTELEIASYTNDTTSTTLSINIPIGWRVQGRNNLGFVPPSEDRVITSIVVRKYENNILSYTFTPTFMNGLTLPRTQTLLSGRQAIILEQYLTNIGFTDTTSTSNALVSYRLYVDLDNLGLSFRTEDCIPFIQVNTLTQSVLLYGNVATGSFSSPNMTGWVSGSANEVSSLFIDGGLKVDGNRFTTPSLYPLLNVAGSRNKLLYVDNATNLAYNSLTLAGDSVLYGGNAGGTNNFVIGGISGQYCGIRFQHSGANASIKMIAGTNGTQSYVQSVNGFTFNSSGTAGVGLNPSGTSWIAISDARLKKNVVDLEPALDKICAFRPVSYIMNEEEDGAKKRFGLIAQEAQLIIPEIVSQMPNIEYIGITYTEIIPFLIKSIQELKAEIDILKSRLP